MSFVVRKLTRCSLICALECVLLYMTALVPVADITLAATAGILNAVVLIQCGMSYSLLTFTAAALLSMITVPDKSVALMYAAFFGYYPIVKSLCEGLRSLVLSWCLKLAHFNCVFVLLWYFARELVFGEVPSYPWLFFAIAVVLNVVFVIFDEGVTRLLSYYQFKFSKYFKI